MPIAGVLQIAVGGNRVDVDALLGQPQFCALDLLGNIPAIQIIDQRTKRSVQTVYISLAAAVKIVVDRDKPQSFEGKHTGDVISYRDIVPAEAGNIFDQNTLDLSAKCRLQQRLHTRAVKIFPAVPIIRKLHHLCTV